MLAIVEPELNGFAQNAADLVVDCGGWDFTALDKRQQNLLVHEERRRHFKVQAAIRGSFAVVGGAPIRHDDAVETPFFSRNDVVQEIVLGHVGAVNQVVCVHKGTHLGFLYGGFEGGKIDLPQGALVHVGTVVHASVFLIVNCEVLRGGDDAPRLYAFNQRNCHARGEVRVFAQVFEIAPVHGRAVDVHPRSQDEMDAARSSVLAHHFADAAGKVDVPRSCQCDSCRIRRCRSVIVHSQRTVGHAKRG